MFCRFDESSISPLTLKALSASGIVKMTRVQDATLSECLDGLHLSCLFLITLLFGFKFFFVLKGSLFMESRSRCIGQSQNRNREKHGLFGISQSLRCPNVMSFLLFL